MSTSPAIYYRDTFDDWKKAVDFQHKALQEIIKLGLPVRAAEIAIEKDFDTKKMRYSVLVRSFEMVKS